MINIATTCLHCGEREAESDGLCYICSHILHQIRIANALKDKYEQLYSEIKSIRGAEYVPIGLKDRYKHYSTLVKNLNDDYETLGNIKNG